MKMTIFFRLSAMTFLLILPFHAKGEDPDSLFNQGKWREALLSYQDRIRNECQSRQLLPSKQSTLSSNLVESDSPGLLKAHCLFERGALAYLKNDYESATKSWVACREALKESPNEGKPYLRRVNMALGQIWARSLTNKDLKFFHDGIADICKTIDEEPLPESTSDFRNQFQQEFRFVFVNTVFTSIPQLNSQNESVSMGVISQKLTELLSKKALYRLLSDESVNTAKSYDAQLDRILFADGDHQIALELNKKLLEAAAYLQGPCYSDLAAMVCGFSAESNLTDIFAGIDVSKLDRNRFGNALYQIVKIEADSSVANRDILLQSIGKHMDSVSWSDPQIRIEMATAIAKTGGAKEALGLLKSIQDAKQGTPIYPHLCAAFAEVLYFAGDFNAALAADSDLPAKAIPPELYYWKGLTYAKQRKSNEAIEALKTFISKAPAADEAPEACFFLGTLCLSSGKKADALRYFQQTVVSYSGSSYAARAEQFTKTLSR